MKDFLKRHGEKVFLVVMALVCGWSLVGSVRSLGKPSVLPREDKDAIIRIRGQIQNGRPAPRKIAPYQEWLGANFDAHGIGEATKAGPLPQSGNDLTRAHGLMSRSCGWKEVR